MRHKTGSGTDTADWRWQARAAVRDAWPVGVGLFPLGVAFGVFVVQNGFAWWWQPIFSIVVYAGSVEYLAVGMVTGGVGWVTAALTALMVNFRHVFYGLTFPVKPIRHRLARAYTCYALTDEAYAIASAKQAKTGEPGGVWIFTMVVWCQLAWVGSGLVGVLVGQSIPNNIKGFDFALVALFTVLAIEAYRANPDRSLPIVAVLLAAVGWWLAPNGMLMPALTLYFGHLLLRYFLPDFDRRLTWKKTQIRAVRLSEGGRQRGREADGND